MKKLNDQLKEVGSREDRAEEALGHSATSSEEKGGKFLVAQWR